MNPDDIEDQDPLVITPPSEDGIDSSNKLGVYDLVQELVKDGEEELGPNLLIAQRNERWVSGDQWQDVGPQGNMVDAWQEYLPRVSQNYLRGIVNTFKARVTSARPSVTAFAATATPEAKRAADISSKLIDYMEKEMQIDNMIDEVVKLGTMHGTAGFKIVYNPKADSVEWYKLSITEFLIDPSKDNFDAADWVIFRSFIDPFSAKVQLKSNGKMPPETEYEAGGRKRKGVEVLELWHKPTDRVPAGLYAKVIGDTVVESIDYPYMMPSLENPGQEEAVLPIVLFRVDYRHGTQYGETWLSDAIPEQRQVNEVEASLTAIRRKISNIKLIVTSDNVRQSLTDGSQVIVSPDIPQWMPTPQLPQLLFADRDHYVKKLYDVAGVNDALVGTANVGGASGRALAYMDELDTMKHGGCAKSLETMLIRAWKLTLQLVQRYYLGDRVMRIAADGEGFDTMAFSSADIQGITVDITPRSGKERFAQSKIAKIEADAQAGLVDPKQIPEARMTASAEPMAVRAQKEMLARDVKLILAGSQPQVNPEVPPELAVAELQDLAQVMRGQAPEHFVLAVQQLAQMYGAQQQAAQQPPQAPPVEPVAPEEILPQG